MIRVTFDILRRINKYVLILYCTYEIFSICFSTYFNYKYFARMYDELMEKKYEQAIHTYFIIVYISIANSFIELLGGIIHANILSIFKKNVSNYFLDKFMNTNNYFLEKQKNIFDDDLTFNTFFEQTSSTIFEKTIGIFKLISTFSSQITKVIILARCGGMITFTYVSVMFCIMAIHKAIIQWHEKYSGKLEEYYKYWRDNYGLLCGITKKLINTNILSEYNEINKIAYCLKYNDPMLSGFNPNTFIDLVYDIIVIIVNYIVFKRVNYVYLLLWYTNNSCVLTLLRQIIDNMWTKYDYDNYDNKLIRNIEKILELLGKCGHKKDQIRIPNEFSIKIKATKMIVDNIEYNIIDDIIMEPNKIILIDGKSGMGKTFLYKILVAMIEEQPPVFLCEQLMNKGFCHFQGQLKYVSPLESRNDPENIYENANLHTTLGLHRVGKDIEKIAKLACISDKFNGTKFGHMSDGECKRFKLAKHIPIDETSNIPILILDEPDNGVDYDTGLKIIIGIIKWYNLKK